MLPVKVIFRPPLCIHLHSERLHQPFQAALCRQTIEMIRIREAVLVKERFGVAPVPIEGVKEIRVHPLAPSFLAG